MKRRRSPVQIVSNGAENLVRPILITKSGESIKSKFYPRLFFSVLFIAILLLAFYIIKPFLPALLTGAIIAYLSYPLYIKTLKYIHNKNLASFAVTVIIVLLLTVPFIIVLGLVSKEAVATYNSLSQNGLSENGQKHNVGANFMKIVCNNENWYSCRLAKYFVNLLPNDDVDYFLKASIEKITVFIATNFYKFAASIPGILLNLFVMLFVIYYLLVDGEAVVVRIKNILPLKEAHKQNVFGKFHDITFGVFYGNIAVAIVQGILGAIGFFVFGVPSPILWGAVMVLFALVPYFGTAIVWLPAALNLIFVGYLQNSTSATVRGMLLIAYGILVISTMDNILKPKIIGKKSNVHPVLVLLGVLGGLNLFGLLGIILGPVLLALLITFIEIYEEEKAELEKYF